jgi:catechol 2,3-dioxygenase-like lactoylglutathione lyase family enzyme
MQLDGVMLFAAELEPMLAFYRDVVGFRPIEETRLDDWVEFDTGGTRFALHQIPRHIDVGPSPTPRENGGCKPILAVDDLAAARVRLTAAGATILERPWGGWDFADPEGNVLGVTQRAVATP